MIHWLVLTGGASSRFGHDKSLADLGGRSLVALACDAAQSTASAQRVTVVGRERSGGPAAAVVSTLRDVDCDFVGVLAVDMPFVSEVLGAVTAAVQLDATNGAVDAWVPVDSDGRMQWLCAVYRRDALLAAARDVPDWDGAPFHRLVGGLTTSHVPIASSVSLLDIDTPEDYERARHLVAGLGD